MSAEGDEVEAGALILALWDIELLAEWGRRKNPDNAALIEIGHVCRRMVPVPPERSIDPVIRREAARAAVVSHPPSEAACEQRRAGFCIQEGCFWPSSGCYLEWYPAASHPPSENEATR